MNSSKNEIAIIDSLRAFAAISVCLFHFVCTVTGYVKNNSVLAFFSVGEYGVHMFFVISGFIIPWSMFKSGYKLKFFFKFFFKRLVRLEPPYVLSILFVIIIMLLRVKFYHTEQDNTNVLNISQVFLHFGYLIPFIGDYHWLNGVYWTLAIEFQYYLLIALVFIPVINFKLKPRLLFYLIVVALSLITQQRFIFYWLPIFTLGILLFLYKVELIGKIEYYIVSAVMLIFCAYNFNYYSFVYCVLALFAILFFVNYRIPILNRIGKISYSMYLFHPVFGATFINVLSHYYASPVQKILVISTGFLITIISSYIMFYIIERPSKNLSSSIKY